MIHRLLYAIKCLSLLFLLTAPMLGWTESDSSCKPMPPSDSTISIKPTETSNTATFTITNCYLKKEFYSINVTAGSDFFTVSPNIFLLKGTEDTKDKKGEPKDVTITCQGAIGLHKGELNVEYYKLDKIDPGTVTYKLECTIALMNQTITFDLSTLPPKTFGSSASFDISSFASASSKLPVTFSSRTSNSICTISGSIVTVNGAGECKIKAEQTGDNNNYNPAPSVSQAFVIEKADQTINFAPLLGKTYEDKSFDISASASSKLPVTFSSTTPEVCKVSGSTVTVVGAGYCTIKADQNGEGKDKDNNTVYNYNPAPSVSQTFEIQKKIQTISISENFPASVTYSKSEPFFDISSYVSASSGLPITFNSTSSDTCRISKSMIVMVKAGSCMIQANQAGDSNYLEVTSESKTLEINQANQTITFPQLPAKTFGDNDFPIISAVASSGLPVTFSVPTPTPPAPPSTCTFDTNKGTIHITGAGSCTIQADQPGDNKNYLAASSVPQTLTINKASQTINFPPLPAKTFGDDDFPIISAVADSGLQVGFSATTGPCKIIDGNTVQISGAGDCVIQADQTGNDNYNKADSVSRTLKINKANQTINFPPLPAKTSGDADFPISAAASSGLPVSFSVVSNNDGSPSTCTFDKDKGTIHITGAGSCTIKADQYGDDNYKQAPSVPRKFTIQKQTLEFVITPVVTQDLVKYDGSKDKGFHEKLKPVITFKSGDKVKIVFGGKVQTGGSGSTCKRYVNPLGSDSENYYFGQIRIPGINNSTLTAIRKGVSEPTPFVPEVHDDEYTWGEFLIPDIDSIDDKSLHLGYVDKPDKYDDNGYYNLKDDKGNDDQCLKADKTTKIDNAFVHITIKR